jgi:osmotically-inducible protein OsmY
MDKTLLLLSGFGLGAGLLYILDPERGKRRRAHARARLPAYRRWTDDLLPTSSSLSRTTHHLGQATRHLGSQARSLLTRGRVPSVDEWSWRQSQARRAGRTGSRNGLLLLGSVGLGIGLMYMLDPSAGRRRRALVRKKARSYWKDAGKGISQAVRDTQNRARGMVAEAGQWFKGSDVPADAVLEARVRAQIGHVITHAGAIGITAHQGCVTLSGPILANEEEKLLATVESVPGVAEVVHQLEVHQDATSISGLQGGNATDR